jgi:hypothetical protein
MSTELPLLFTQEFTVGKSSTSVFHIRLMTSRRKFQNKFDQPVPNNGIIATTDSRLDGVATHIIYLRFFRLFAVERSKFHRRNADNFRATLRLRNCEINVDPLRRANNSNSQAENDGRRENTAPND